MKKGIKRKIISINLILSLVLLNFPIRANATELVLQPGSEGIDTYMDVCNSANTNGSGGSMKIGLRSTCGGSYPGGPYHSLLKFDLSGIPSNATINSASLEVYIEDYEGSNTFRFYQATSDWDESTSWNTKPSYNGTILHSISSSAGRTYVLRTVDVASDIQNWIDGTWSNYGWYIRGSNEGSWTRHNMATSDSSNTSYRPKLTIDYTAALNSTPSAPTELKTEGQTDPAQMEDTTPEFSAIYNDSDSGDIANKYQIQVDDNSDFSSPIWDSGSAGTSMSNCTEGTRCADITYAGSALADQTTYYWRIKFWDDDGEEGSWSAAAGWYNGSWSYRRPITIDNSGNGSALSNYQVQVDVTYDSDMNADFSDLRFTDSDGTTELDYWVENYTESTSATVWVEIPSISASSSEDIYMYYGNSEASSASNGDNTFDFFDDFNDNSIDTNKWTSVGNSGFATPTETNQELKIYDNSASGSSYWWSWAYAFSSSLPSGNSYIAEVEAKKVSTGGTGIEYWFGLTESTSKGYVIGWNTESSGKNEWRMNSDLSHGRDGSTTCVGSTARSPNTSWHTFKIIYDANGDDLYCYEDNNQRASCTNVGWTSTGLRAYIGLNARISGDSADVRYDNVKVRKYTSTEPSTSVGAEEPQSDPDQFTTYFDAAPFAPTGLTANDQTNPTALEVVAPTFKATYNGQPTDDIATDYQIQVDNDSDFSSPFWDSGKTSMTDCTQGTECSSIDYGGSELVRGITYYWRIKLWDDVDQEGNWSEEGSSFVLKTGCPDSTNTISVPYTCYFRNNLGSYGGKTLVGLHSFSDSSNITTLSVQSGKSVQIGSTQSLVVGEIDVSGDSGSIVIEEGGEIKPGAVIWYKDDDGDGYPSSTEPTLSKTQPSDGTYVPPDSLNSTSTEDCNDNDDTAYDGVVCYADSDGDNYSVDTPTSFCGEDVCPVDYKETADGDCNDSDGNRYQYLSGYVDADGDTYTVGGQVDNICSGASLPTGYTDTPSGTADCNDNNADLYEYAPCYPDADSDGYFATSTEQTCAGTVCPVSHSDTPGTDCNDGDGNIYQNLACYPDNDSDGYYNKSSEQVCSGDTCIAGYSDSQGTDCDDTDDTNYQDLTAYIDSDGDGYGTGESSLICSGDNLPAGYADNGTDCNDSDGDLYQNLTCYPDSDSDGYYATGSEEVCSGVSCLAGYSSSQGTDCNDSDDSKWQNIAGYVDNDNDSYTVGTSQQICSGDTLPSGYTDTQSGSDDIDDNNDCADDTTTHLCGDGGTDGTCIAVSAGENGLDACQTCNGSSIDAQNIADNTQDTEGSNLCNSNCKTCNGAGSCINQDSGEDLFSQCDVNACLTGTCNASGSCAIYSGGEKGTCGDCYHCSDGDSFCDPVTAGTDPNGECSATACYTGNCDGSGSCSIYSGGEEGACSACQYCNDGDSACDPMADGSQDTAGSNLCNSVCMACDGLGSCTGADAGTDPGNDCEATDCGTGNCDGSGACAVYSSGEKGTCGDCYYCNDSDSSCDPVTAGTDPNNECSATDCYTGNCDGSGTCGIYSSGEKGSCSTCYYCNDADSDCDLVGSQLDPNDDCAVGSWSCDGNCRRLRDSGTCDGAGSCRTNDEADNCALGEYCSGGTCSTGACDTNWHCSTNTAYQYTCDGSNNCDQNYNGDDCSDCSCTCGDYTTSTEDTVSCSDGIDNDCDGNSDSDDMDCRDPNGTPCSNHTDCQSGNCIDGYCCNTTCTGTCVACDVSGNEGACTSVPNGQDPDNECGTTGCGTGNCDGSGSCGVYNDNQQHNCSSCQYCSDSDAGCENVPNGQDPNGNCGTTDCYTGNCNGSGSCNIYSGGQKGSCGTCYYCSDSDSSCDLVPNNQDPNGECNEPYCESYSYSCISNDVWALADECTANTCNGSGSCACDNWSSGGCDYIYQQQCDSSYCNYCTCGFGEGDCDSDSHCEAGLICGYNNGADFGCPSTYETCVECDVDGDCNTGYVCDNHYCKKGNGQTCSSGSECGSGICKDGYCCNSSCTGTCQACDVSGSEGTCTNIPSGQDPDGECSSTGCGTGTCNGSGSCGVYNDNQQHNCGSCQYCADSDASCENVPSGSDPNSNCSGCQTCNGSGSCADDNSECSATNCYTGTCSGGTCTIYSGGQKGTCGNCMYCNDGDSACDPVTAGTDPNSECSATNCYTGNCDGSGSCDIYSGGQKGACGTCYYCNDGDSSCDLVPSGQDPGGECSTSQCGTGNCDGSGSCGAYNDGQEHNCPGCYYCNDSDVGCEVVPNGTDPTGACSSGECLSCNNGNCEDDNSLCSATDCYTGTCSAGSCNVYSSGEKGACGTCQYCTDSDSACENVSSGNDPYGDCSGCQTCSGSGSCADDDSECSATNCYTGTCTSGSCDIYSGGQKGTCGTCYYCGDSDSACDPVPSGQDPGSDCAAGSWECNGICQKKRIDGNCNGSGSCSTSYEYANVAYGNICSGGSEVSDWCNVTDYVCDGDCRRKREKYNCNEGSCSHLDQTQYLNVSSGNICSGGSEVSGVCGYSGYNGCNGDCQKKRDELACDGSNSCSYDVGNDYANVSQGFVCSAGSEIDPYPSDYCGQSSWYCYSDCVRRYDNLACNGSGSCTYDGGYYQSGIADGKICSGGSEVTGICNYSSYNGCVGDCQKKRDELACGPGWNECNYDVGDDTANVAADKVCSGGSEISGVCGYGSWSCSGDCQRVRDEYACNGSNSCSYDTGNDYTDVAGGKVCSGGSEISVSTSNYACDEGQCSQGSCSGIRYYYGCNGSGSCDTSGFYAHTFETIYPSYGYIFDSSCYDVNASCGYSSYNGCNGSCQKKRDVLYCNGSGSCNVDGGNNYANIASGKICSNGSEVYGFCNSTINCQGDYSCSGYACNGSGSCGSAVGDYTSRCTNCNNWGSWESNGCSDGYCWGGVYDTWADNCGATSSWCQLGSSCDTGWVSGPSYNHDCSPQCFDVTGTYYERDDGKKRFNGSYTNCQ